MNARLAPVSLQTSEALIAEAKLRGCLRTIYDSGGMPAVVAAATRVVQEIARENRDELDGWVV